MARIYDLCHGALDKRKVCGLVTFCGQDRYEAKVPQHPIDFYRYISHIKDSIHFDQDSNLISFCALNSYCSFYNVLTK